MRASLPVIAVLAFAVVLFGPPATVSAQLLSRQIAGSLENAQEAIQKGDYAGAAEIIDRLLERNLASFEKAVILRTKGYLLAERDDLDAAIESFEAALATESLKAARENDLILIVGQLHLAQERYDKGVEWLTRWYEGEEQPTGQNLMTYAQSLAQIGNYDRAVTIAEQALAGTDAAPQNWYEFVSSLYLFREQPKKAIPIAREGLSHYPDARQLWQHFASAHFDIGKTAEALAAMQFMRMRGLIQTGGEYVFLSQLHLQQGTPHYGALALEEGLEKEIVKPTRDNLDLLASAWQTAREMEKAVEPLRRAAEAAEDGQTFIRLGHLHMRREAWAKAAEAYRQGLSKGPSDDRNQVRLWRGIALARQGDNDAALEQLRKAARDAEYKDRAKVWINQITQDQKTN